MSEQRFREPPEGGEKDPPIMQDGIFYDLDPPSLMHGKRFFRVKCVYRVPDAPKEYVVSGIPEGCSEEELFVLRFTERGVRVTRSEQQESGSVDDSRGARHPHLKLVK